MKCQAILGLSCTFHPPHLELETFQEALISFNEKLYSKNTIYTTRIQYSLLLGW